MFFLLIPIGCSCSEDSCLNSVSALSNGQTINCPHENHVIRTEGIKDELLVYCECPNNRKKSTDILATPDASTN